METKRNLGFIMWAVGNHPRFLSCEEMIRAVLLED
jgi:hypothetical protein